ncbi:VPDSG-CTERM sorting domain-containing protein [Pelagicoccus sp. NFK12]|uniref:VPDSG-CTERM sorting domain-containing protein n=1 Tax=Pelagicoccus enzymogenes TaxID=2773457 RepID=A0A927F404_9BACT|nr:VPDSG-CTERM sorting domain-containing protein [Pelagicoccus enzymogenes]MBD5778007.1 VPDSG-CTERM sorting domain-containing protein [Pelagicoccus enzymogenes]
MKKTLITSLIALTATISANAISFGFTQITSNGPEDVSAQLSADVQDVNGTQVSFKFSNTGPIASTIGEIYFDHSGLLASLDSVLGNSAGVDFSDFSPNPSNLPGGNSVSPTFTSDFGAEAAPGNGNGIDPGEWVTFGLTLTNGVSFADLITGLNSGSVRLGMHVRAIGQQGASEGYINNPNDPGPGPGPDPVPDSGTTLALLGAALLGVIGFRRFKK